MNVDYVLSFLPFAEYNEGTDAGYFIIETGSRIINNERHSYNSYIAYYRYWWYIITYRRTSLITIDLIYMQPPVTIFRSNHEQI